MKKSSKKLALDKQVVRNLTKHDATQVIGGRPTGGTEAQCSNGTSTCGPGVSNSCVCAP